MSHPQTHIVGPAHWASFLINGDASGLSPEERDMADAWLARERVRIIGTEPGAEPYFTWSAAVHCPELGVAGMEALDYRAEELSIDE